MKIAGHRKERMIERGASSECFKEGARFVEEAYKILGGEAGFFPKGAYHYKSHDEAENHLRQALSAAIKKRNKL